MLLLFQPSKYFQLTQDSTKALWWQLPGWLHLLLNEEDRTDMWTQLSIRTMYQDRALWLIFTVQGLITYRPVYQTLPTIAINDPGFSGIPGISTARHPIKQNFNAPRLHCIIAEWTILHCWIKWQYGTFHNSLLWTVLYCTINGCQPLLDGNQCKLGIIDKLHSATIISKLFSYYRHCNL